MRLVDSFAVQHSSGPRSIRLYVGDLTAIPPAEAVDLLVVSAYPDDYLPTQHSLIGELHLKGLSVQALAEDKEVDLRRALSCWLSRDVAAEHPGLGFRRILCFEPRYRGQPAEVVGDVFRSLIPFAYGEPPVTSVAMPILASGDQGADPKKMLAATLDAAVHWMERGLPIRTLKIVIRPGDDVEHLKTAFAEARASHTPPERRPEPGSAYDYFVSYSHEDSREVQELVHDLQRRSNARIFLDKLELKPGDAWQSELDAALEGCRKFIAVYSPAYLGSKVCMEEFNMARLRHRESQGGVILPLYLRSADLPLYMKSLQYIDCREGAMEKVRSACDSLLADAPG
ncbi:MAG TPA: toll/interleukin-1 receptor domain-containing protein [Longimicrobiaceae bacterium]|nr:toll/interleukin-1 receptor domain-containing protein [Longimicrobiaceae bacterium]